MRRRWRLWWCRWFHRSGWQIENTEAYYCPFCQEYREL